MKKLALVLSLILCVSALAVVFVACELPGEKEQSFVALDINPSMELIVDGNGKVVNVSGTNEDGQVLLYGEVSDLVGKDVEDVVDQLTKLSIQLGYLTEDNKVVQYTVSAEGATQTKLEGKIEAGVQSASSTASFTLTTDSQGAYSLVRRYEAFIAEHPQFANISVANFRLALAASETGEVTLEAAVTMDHEQLVAIVGTAREKIGEFATSAYNFAKSQAIYAYDQVAATAVDMVYPLFYVQNVLKYYDKAWLGGAYAMYSIGADSLKALANVAQWAIETTNMVLGSEQVSQVLDILGLTEEQKALISDADGNITLQSIEAYADKAFKNSQVAAELEQVKAELSAVLNQVESHYNQIATKYATEIETIKTAIQGIVDVMKLIPGVDEFATDMNEVLAKIQALAADGASVQDIRELAIELDAQAAEKLTAIEAHITEEEKEQINTMKASAEQKFASAKAIMEQKIAEAEQKAKDYLAQLKAERQQNATA